MGDSELADLWHGGCGCDGGGPGLQRYVVDVAGGRGAAGGDAGGGGGSAGARKRAPRSDGGALEGLTTTAAECAEDAGRDPGAPCAGRRVVEAITAFVRDVGAAAPTGAAEGPAEEAALPSAPTPDAAAVRAAAAALGCESESCVLVNPVFRRYVVEKRLLPEAALDRELEVRFKARGPRASRALLSNFNIDDTLRRWARVFPEFFPCPFAMMDFDRTQEPFAAIDLADVLEGREPADLGPGFGSVARPAECFGCVVNTDVSSGPGKHWVAVFVDCRPPPGEAWTVEYFNSAGRPPPRPMTAWMERTRARLAEYRARRVAGAVETVPVTDLDHQESQTECGLYALYYIRRRLEGTPHTFFFQQLVPDAAMTAFRAHVFRAS